MAINEHWNIKSRAHECSQTGTKFADGDAFFTALFEDPETGELVRKDFSESAWHDVHQSLDPQPQAHWRSKYEAPTHDPKVNVVESTPPNPSCANLSPRTVRSQRTPATCSP